MESPTLACMVVIWLLIFLQIKSTVPGGNNLAALQHVWRKPLRFLSVSSASEDRISIRLDIPRGLRFNMQYVTSILGLKTQRAGL